MINQSVISDQSYSKSVHMFSETENQSSDFNSICNNHASVQSESKQEFVPM